MKKLVKPDCKILNVGAATGRTSEMLSKYGQVTSLEFDKHCCEFVIENLKFDITNGSVLALPYADNSFDMVCAFDVIEHVEDDALAMSEMKRVCKSGGLLAITVPAFMSLWSHHDVVNHHFRRYTKTNLKQVFAKNMLDTNVVTYYNTILFFPIFIFRIFTKVIPQKWIRTGAGSDATLTSENGIVNAIMKNIFSIELFFLKFIKFPFGVSIFISSTKK